jgi:hypothetical protein
MRRYLPSPVLIVCMVAAAAALHASGRIGIYGIVEKVIFEPSEQAPERVQIWGAFAYADITFGGHASAARRGYLYFSLPDGGGAERPAAVREWSDLKALAGTGQAVAFGEWGVIGDSRRMDPATTAGPLPFILGGPANRENNDVRVRPASEPPAAPATYRTNTGLVKLSDQGSRADVVKELRRTLGL